jgi:hypothetical protein
MDGVGKFRAVAGQLKIAWPGMAGTASARLRRINKQKSSAKTQ